MHDHIFSYLIVFHHPPADDRSITPQQSHRAAEWIIKLANCHPDAATAAEKGEDAVVRFIYGPDEGMIVHIVRSKRTASQMKSQLRSYKTIPSLTIELCVKSQDGGASFVVMPGCVLEGFAALADPQKMVQSFLKATDVGSMSYVFDEELPTKVMRVFEGDTPGIAVKTEVVGVAKVIKGADITAIEKEKTNAAAAAARAPAPAPKADATPPPAKVATDPAATATTAAATTSTAVKKKKDKVAAKKKQDDKEGEDVEKPPTKPKAAGKKGKDPNAPKRGSNAYMFYANTNRSKVKEANKEASNSGLLKILGESWKKLTPEEKKPYEDMAAKDKERYQKEMEAYKPKEDVVDEPVHKPTSNTTQKKAKAKSTAKETSTSSASGKKKDAPTADTAAEIPKAKPKAMTQAAKKAEEKKEVEMLQAKFLELPKKAQDAAIKHLPVTSDRIHTLGTIGRDIMRQALSEAGVLDDNSGKGKSSSTSTTAAAAAPATATKKKAAKASTNDDAIDGSSDAGATASTKRKAPSTPKSKTKATAITSPNAKKHEMWESLTEAPKRFVFPPQLKAQFAKGKYSKEEKWTMFLKYLKQQRKTVRAKQRKAETEAAAKEKGNDEEDSSSSSDESQDESSSKSRAAKKRKKLSSAKKPAAAGKSSSDNDESSSDDDFENPKSKKKKSISTSAKKASSNATSKKRKKSSDDEVNEDGTKPKSTKTPKKSKGANGHEKGSLEEVMDPNFKVPKALAKKFARCDTFEQKQKILANHREKVRQAVQKSHEKKKKKEETGED